MNVKMPKLAYRFMLGVFLFAFVASSTTSCGKKKKEKVIEKPTDGGTVPATPPSQ